MHTVFFIVTMITFAAANTVQCDINCKDTQTFNQMNPLQLNEISNRFRRNASEVPNTSETPETDDDANRGLIQDILSHIPSKDIIKSLLLGRIKRAYFDYDTSEDQENVTAKSQLEQIKSGIFAPNAYDEDQRRKLFFSQLFSMIDDSTNFEKSKTGNENHDPLTSRSSADIHEIIPGRSKNQGSGGPIRKNKKRRQVQESSLIPHNLKDQKQLNARPERQLGELINDENADTQFYKFNKYASKTAGDYDSVEPSIEEQLPYYTGDEGIESTMNIMPSTTDSSVVYGSNEEVNYDTHLVSPNASTFDSQSNENTTPDDILITKENTLVSTSFPLNPSIYNIDQPKNLTYFNFDTTEPSSNTKSTNTSDAVETNKDFVKNENVQISKDVSSNDNVQFMTTNPLVEKVDNANENQYIKGPAGISQDFYKIQSRQTNANLKDKKLELKQIENVSKLDHKEAGQTQDVEVANIYGQADVTANHSNVLVNPLSARIKLDFLIQLQALGNNE